MKGLLIKGLVETSLSDWDGKISCVVFLPGCDFVCPFCQNGDLVLRWEALPDVDLGQTTAYLERNRDWIDGVVLTGGEPTIWEDLGGLAARFKGLGLAVKLDTNGSLPGVVEHLVKGGLVDYLAMDVKAPLDRRYDLAAGVPVDLDDLKRSVEVIKSSGLDYEFRTTLVPELVGPDEVVDIARAISGAKRYVLQRFVPENSLDTRLRTAVSYSDDFISGLVERARPHVKQCFYRGRTGVALS